MNGLGFLRTQWLNYRSFRAFFPVARTLIDAIRFPFDYARDGRARPFPRVIDLNVTNRCHLKCRFCYNRDNVVSRSGELSPDEIDRLVVECARHGAGVFLSGGEPLLRPDFPSIVKSFKSRRLPVGLVTSAVDGTGTLDALLDTGLDMVVISFHGMAPVHDGVQGQEGAWEQALDAFRRAARRMDPPGPLANYVVTEDSIRDLPAFLDEVRSIRNGRVRLAHLSFLTPAESAAHEREWPRRVGSPVPELLNFVDDPPEGLAGKVRAVLRDPRASDVIAKPVLSGRELDAWYSSRFTVARRCLFLWQSTVINADGTVLPCQYYRAPMGNIREEPLARIWNNDRYRAFRRALKEGLLPGCSRCCKL